MPLLGTGASRLSWSLSLHVKRFSLVYLLSAVFHTLRTFVVFEKAVLVLLFQEAKDIWAAVQVGDIAFSDVPEVR